MSTTTVKSEPVLNAPVILDLGKAKRRDIRLLRQGQGELVAEVQSALHDVTVSLGDQAAGKQIIPVVLIYQKKARRIGRGGSLIPGIF
jgi:hypothetical protein